MASETNTFPMPMPIETITCRRCGNPTRMLGTKLCDGCWELETRIKRDPEIARKILEEESNANKRTE